MGWIGSLAILCSLIAAALGDSRGQSVRTSANLTLLRWSSQLQDKLRDVSVAEWNYETNITDANLKATRTPEDEMARFMEEIAGEAEDMLRESGGLLSARERRELYLYAEAGKGVPKSQVVRNRLARTVEEMVAIYSTATDAQERPLDPDLEQILATSRNESELRTVWTEWRDTVGPELGPLFANFVRDANTGARDTGYRDAGEVWRSGYDMDGAGFEKSVASGWDELRGFYEELHCYVRSKLASHYGEKNTVDSAGRIHAHVLGNMWAQNWDNVYDLVAPHPDREAMDITETLRQQGYTPQRLLDTAQKFYQSLGFPPFPAEVWKRSMITKPHDREVVCHPSAWDVARDDFRLKMCMKVNQEDFITVHHEMGHMYYYKMYEDLPMSFHDGANDGFHEAVGDTVSLSAFTNKYLQHLGLLPHSAERDESARAEQERALNFLMLRALQDIAFLPYGYLIDLYRWDIFAGKIKPHEYNRRYWDLREQIQGVSAPSKRPDDGFDAGAKFHVPANVPYMRYFLASVYKFQFHDALCRIAGHSGPLHECSIFNSTEAGDAFQKMLALGCSVPWQDAMESLTGERTLDTRPILRYFAPLRAFLREQNSGRSCGWATAAELPLAPTRTTAWRYYGIIVVCSLSAFVVYGLRRHNKYAGYLPIKGGAHLA